MYAKEMKNLPKVDRNDTTAQLLERCSSSYFLARENVDSEMHQAQLAYFGGYIATYMPNTVIYPHMMGMRQGRVPLPLKYAENFSIYVNAKQYHAILKRRKIRAKFEAQNKRTTSKKPYIHESRHLHAIKRARGSGGRFLNTKTIKHSLTYDNCKSRKKLGEFFSHGEYQHSESSSLETSTHSNSDVTSIFSGDDQVYLQQELNVSSSEYQIGASMAVKQGFTHGRI